MPKIAVKDTTLILSCKGPWQWQAGKELAITVPCSGQPLTSSGSTALLSADLLKALSNEVPGQGYLHGPTAKSPGKVSVVDASIDPGSPASKITVGGEPATTDATTGRFTIIAGAPSAEPNGVTDPLMVHSGTWKVKETPQEGLTECTGKEGTAEAMALGAPANAAPEAATPARGAEDVTEEGEDVKGHRITLELRLSDDSLYEVWGPEMLSSGGGLSLEVGVAQPDSGGAGLVGRFRKLVLWDQLLAEGLPPLPKTVSLSPGEIDPSRPAWISILGRPFGGKPECREESISQIALFTMSESSETGSPRTVVVRPDRLPRGFTAPKGHDGLWVKPDKADGEGEEGAATALLRIAPARLEERDGWVKIENRPDPPAPWTTLHRPVKHELREVEVPEVQCVPPIYEPCQVVELAPLRPQLLAATLVAQRLSPELEEITDLLTERLPATTLATRLEQFLGMEGVVERAVEEGIPKMSPPDTILREKDRSRGLVNGKSLLYCQITPARLFLLRHFASMRERGFALRDEADRLFERLDQKSIDRFDDISDEQRKARFFLGPLALDRNETGAERMSNEHENNAEELKWEIDVARALVPDWDALDQVTILAVRCLHVLSQLDFHFREAETLGPGFSKGGHPLLDAAARERWNRIVRDRLVEDDHATLKGLFRSQEILPALYQIEDVVRRGRIPGYLLRKIAIAYEQLKKNPLMANARISRMTSTRIKAIYQSTEIIAKFALHHATVRKAMISIGIGRNGLVARVWVMEGKLRLERIRLETSRQIKIQTIRNADLRGKSIKIGGPQLERIFDKIGKARDGFFAIVYVVDIVQRLKDENGLDRFQDKAQVLNDLLSLVDIGFRRIPRMPKAMKMIRLSSLIAYVQCAISLVESYEAWHQGRDKDAAREIVVGICMILMVPQMRVFLGLSGVAIPVVIVAALFSIVGVQFLRSGLPDDIEACADRLTALVAACVFGNTGFPALVGSRADPDRPRAPERLKAEVEWLTRVETKPCDPDRNARELARIMAAATALVVEFKTAVLSVGRRVSDPDWLDWFGQRGQAAGYRLTMPATAFLGGSERVFFQRDAASDYGISIRVEYSTDKETTEILVQTGRREDDLCYPEGGIGLGVVRQEKSSSARTAPLTLLLVVGAYSPLASARLTLQMSENAGSNVDFREIECLILPDSDALEPKMLRRGAKIMLSSRDGGPDYVRQPDEGEPEKIMLDIQDDQRALYWNAC